MDLQKPKSFKKSPIVSMGMPVYNGERYLQQALDSLLNQTFTEFELIISDNASTDRTFEICYAYAQTDERVRLLQNEVNAGAAANYNKVFAVARGRYFKWAAADDVCAPTFLKRCVGILQDDPSIILAYPKTTIINQEGRKVKPYDDGLHLKSKSASGRFLQFMYCVGECNAVFGLVRADVLKKTRLIGSYIGSDVCLLAELSLLGRFYEIPEYLFFRRHHPAASSSHKDVQSQLVFFDPAIHTPIALPKWRHFGEHFKSIKRANIPVSQKVLPALFLIGSLGVSGRDYARELCDATKWGFLRCGKKLKQPFNMEHRAS